MDEATSRQCLLSWWLVLDSRSPVHSTDQNTSARSPRHMLRCVPRVSESVPRAQFWVLVLRAGAVPGAPRLGLARVQRSRHSWAGRWGQRH